MLKRLFFLLLPLPLMAQPDNSDNRLITNVSGRNISSLNGKWNYIIDPYEMGFYDYRYHEAKNGFFQNRKASDKMSLVEYDFDRSGRINVPSDWNSQDPSLLYYEGTVWYKKSFNYTLKPGKRLFLYIGAANYIADVYLNSTKLGRHEGGFTPFNFEITGLVKERDNFIIIKVDNKRHPDGVPTLNTDWWNYGGITRDVMLIEEQEVFVRDYSIGLKKGSKEVITGLVALDKPIPGQRVSIKIPELKMNVSGETNNEGNFAFEVKSKPVLWSPENPKLYGIQLSLGSEVLSDRVGFRTIETSGNKILLNGNVVFLKGICIHEEIPMRQARASSPEDAKILLGWAKELGCNFVRLAHYPHNEYMTRMADSLGLMVWSEIPVYWAIEFENEKTYQLAEKQLTENITRDKNRASIVIWSVGNETPQNETRLVFMSRLVEQAHKLDPSRLVSAALQVHLEQGNDSLYRLTDPLGKYLDVVTCNEYIGWYDGLPEKADRVRWESIYNKPFIFSELGAGAVYDFHGDSLTRWSVEFQSYVYEKQIEMMNKIPFLSGVSPWILADFRSPRRLLPGVQDGWNRKGLISDQGFKKPAFYILRDWYKTK